MGLKITGGGAVGNRRLQNASIKEIKVKVVIDHKPPLALYNGLTKDRSARVETFVSKLGYFDFIVKHEPGVTNPSEISPLKHVKMSCFKTRRT